MSYRCIQLGYCRNFTGYIPPDLAGGTDAAIGQGSSKSGLAVTPVVISLIVILGIAFILISYYAVFSKYCRSFGSIMRERRGSRDGMFGSEVSMPMIGAGLQDSVVKAIPVCKYSKADGLVEGTECAVCLSEFEENVSLRLLPKCSHAFHIPCIDKWLQSHSNCPLCRANIVSTAQSISISVTIPSELRGVDEISEDPSESQSQEVTLPTGNNPQEQASGNTVEGVLHTPRVFSNFEQQTEAEGDHPPNLGEWLESSTDNKICSSGVDKFPSRFTILRLSRTKSSSRNFTFNNGWFDKRHTHCSGNMPGFRRSQSTGSFGVNTVLDFSVYPDSSQNTVRASRSHEGSTRIEQTTTVIEDSTGAVSKDLSSGDSCGTDDIPGFRSSDNRGGNRSFKSRSYSCAISRTSNAKADAVNSSCVRLMSLKCPRGVKRTLSGGRIFGFMTGGRARNTSEDIDTRSGILTCTLRESVL